LETLQIDDQQCQWYSHSKHNGQTASSNVDKANLINNDFSSCFNQEHPQLSKPDLDKFPVDPNQCPVDLLCDVDEVMELLSSLQS